MKNNTIIFIILLLTVTICKSQNPCKDLQSIAYGGLVYRIKAIGTQCWLRENLNIGNMIAGNQIQNDNGKIEKYCYDNEEENCVLFGGLYQWEELMQYKNIEGSTGICPNGWHVPTDLDFDVLETYLGMPNELLNKTGSRGNNLGIKLLIKKETGFDALLSGCRNENGLFYDANVGGYFWTSSPDNIGKQAVSRSLIKDDKSIYRSYQNFYKGFSVRCIKTITNNESIQEN